MRLSGRLGKGNNADQALVKVVVGDHQSFRFDERVFGALVQYPATDGGVLDYRDFCARAPPGAGW